MGRETRSYETEDSARQAHEDLYNNGATTATFTSSGGESDGTGGEYEVSFDRDSMDVGIDSAYRILGEYRPFSYDEIARIMAKREHNPVDHHLEGKLRKEGHIK
jgi:hypothetical protein